MARTKDTERKKRNARRRTKRAERKGQPIPEGVEKVELEDGHTTKPRIIDYGLKGVWLTVLQFARESGRSKDLIRQRIATAQLKPMVVTGGLEVYRMKDLIDAVILRDQTGSVDPEQLDPFRRKAYYAAESIRMKLREQAGELIPREQYENEAARVAKVVTHFYDTLPDVLERDCGLTPQQILKVEQRLDRVREEMYSELVSAPDEVVAPVSQVTEEEEADEDAQLA